MEMVYIKFKVTLKDKKGDEINFKCLSFYELDEEIRMITSIKNEDLQRGWIGNLTYEIDEGREWDSGDETPNQVVTETFNDVLLASIRLNEATYGSPCSWEYRFLKK